MIKKICYIFAAIFLLAQFADADSVLVFNEIMYHPAAISNEAVTEWIELHNEMAVDLDVSDWKISGGIDFIFPVGAIIPAGGYVLVAAAPSILEGQITMTNVYGPFSGKLSNAGETLRLLNNSARLMDKISYRDSGEWPVAADGSGASLAKINPNSASEPAENWSASSQFGGTPGEKNSNVIVENPTNIFFNEILPATSFTNFWLEIKNASAYTLNLTGYKIRNSGAISDYVFASGTIASGEFKIVTADELGFAPADNDKLFLYSSSGQILDAKKVTNKLRGRDPNSGGEWLYPETETPGAENLFSFQ